MAKDSGGRSSARKEFTALSFIWRFLGALVLVLATYNPTEYSVFHWVRSAVTGDGIGPEHFVVCAILLIGWTILLVATRNSLNTIGVILGALFLAAMVWWLIDLGVLTTDSISSVTWIVLVCLALLLGIGLSWSHIWRRLTGQLETTDEEE